MLGVELVAAEGVVLGTLTAEAIATGAGIAGVGHLCMRENGTFHEFMQQQGRGAHNTEATTEQSRHLSKLRSRSQHEQQVFQRSDEYTDAAELDFDRHTHENKAALRSGTAKYEHALAKAETDALELGQEIDDQRQQESSLEHEIRKDLAEVDKVNSAIVDLRTEAARGVQAQKANAAQQLETLQQLLGHMENEQNLCDTRSAAILEIRQLVESAKAHNAHEERCHQLSTHLMGKFAEYIAFLRNQLLDEEWRLQALMGKRDDLHEQLQLDMNELSLAHVDGEAQATEQEEDSFELVTEVQQTVDEFRHCSETLEYVAERGDIIEQIKKRKRLLFAPLPEVDKTAFLLAPNPLILHATAVNPVSLVAKLQLANENKGALFLLLRSISRADRMVVRREAYQFVDVLESGTLRVRDVEHSCLCSTIRKWQSELEDGVNLPYPLAALLDTMQASVDGELNDVANLQNSLDFVSSAIHHVRYFNEQCSVRLDIDGDVELEKTLASCNKDLRDNGTDQANKVILRALRSFTEELGRFEPISSSDFTEVSRCMQWFLYTVQEIFFLWVRARVEKANELFLAPEELQAILLELDNFASTTLRRIQNIVPQTGEGVGETICVESMVKKECCVLRAMLQRAQDWNITFGKMQHSLQGGSNSRLLAEFLVAALFAWDFEMAFPIMQILDSSQNCTLREWMLLLRSSQRQMQATLKDSLSSTGEGEVQRSHISLVDTQREEQLASDRESILKLEVVLVEATTRVGKELDQLENKTESDLARKAWEQIVHRTNARLWPDVDSFGASVEGRQKREAYLEVVALLLSQTEAMLKKDWNVQEMMPVQRFSHCFSGLLKDVNDGRFMPPNEIPIGVLYKYHLAECHWHTNKFEIPANRLKLLHEWQETHSKSAFLDTNLHTIKRLEQLVNVFSPDSFGCSSEPALLTFSNDFAKYGQLLVEELGAYLFDELAKLATEKDGTGFDMFVRQVINTFKVLEAGPACEARSVKGFSSLLTRVLEMQGLANELSWSPLATNGIFQLHEAVIAIDDAGTSGLKDAVSKIYSQRTYASIRQILQQLVQPSDRDPGDMKLQEISQMITSFFSQMDTPVLQAAAVVNLADVADKINALIKNSLVSQVQLPRLHQDIAAILWNSRQKLLTIEWSQPSDSSEQRIMDQLLTLPLLNEHVAAPRARVDKTGQVQPGGYGCSASLAILLSVISGLTSDLENEQKRPWNEEERELKAKLDLEALNKRNKVLCILEGVYCLVRSICP
jgi:hypothetical protein